MKSLTMYAFRQQKVVKNTYKIGIKQGFLGDNTRLILGISVSVKFSRQFTISQGPKELS
jgi:hypothetical protein